MKKTLVWLLTISLVLACMPAMGMAESLGTIKVWYSGDNEGTRVELFEKAKAEIEAEYPGTTVEIETIAYSELNAAYSLPRRCRRAGCDEPVGNGHQRLYG